MNTPLNATTPGWRDLPELQKAQLLEKLQSTPSRTRQSLLARVTLPTLSPFQQQIVSEAKRFNVLCVGRRAGKTYLGVRLALEVALTGGRVGWFAPTYKLLLEAWDAILLPLKTIPGEYRANQSAGRIKFSNGGLFEIWSLDDNPDAGRSREYDRVVVDEAAVASKLKRAWGEGISPTLTTRRGDAWILSTPKGLNYFYDLYQRHFDNEKYPDWRAWQMPSSVSPYMPPEEFERERAQKPEMEFRQEYLAEFIAGDGAVFRKVDENLTADLTTPQVHRDHTVVAGVDWGQAHDFTAISVICCHCQQEIAIDRFNQVGWALQRDRILGIAATWHVKTLLVERNSIGGPNLEALYEAAPDGITIGGFTMSHKTKPQIVRGLALALERQALRWLSDQTARHEMLAYEATPTESGYTKYSAPEGQHDDTVVARMIAYRAAQAFLPIPLTEEQRIDAHLPAGWQIANAPALSDPQHDRWHHARDWAAGKIRKKERDANRDINDPWSGWTPAGAGEDHDPWAGQNEQ